MYQNFDYDRRLMDLRMGCVKIPLVTASPGRELDVSR